MDLGLQFFEYGVINNNAVIVISKNFLPLLTFDPVAVIQQEGTNIEIRRIVFFP